MNDTTCFASFTVSLALNVVVFNILVFVYYGFYETNFYYYYYYYYYYIFKMGKKNKKKKKKKNIVVCNERFSFLIGFQIKHV